MVFEKIIGSLSGETAKEVVTLPFEWDEATKRIMKKTASSGEEIGVRLSEHMFDGAILFEDDSRIIALSLVPCEVTRLYAGDLREMGRACFELGNRHIPLTFGEGWVDTPYERPTFEYLEKKGFRCEKVTTKFIPEVTVRGHSHD
ncbi:MAG: urease accessory protein UreE [Oscillospiraceae bacterium]|nr:urease accessory protein UreE [Oscillospiraceae bacterium]